MKYCTWCGKELLDEAVICPYCGCETELGKEHRIGTATSSEMNGTKVCGILSIVFGVLVPIVGFVLAIVCMVNDKDKKFKPLWSAGLALSVLVIVLGLILISNYA